VEVVEQLPKNCADVDTVGASTAKDTKLSLLTGHIYCSHGSLFEDPLISDNQVACMMEMNRRLGEYTLVCVLILVN
jgi:hypothetical protein